MDVADLNQLAGQGWLLLRGAVSAGQLAALHAAWERRAARPAGAGAEVPDTVAEHDWGPSGLEAEAEFSAVLGHPRLLAAVEALIGRPFELRGCHGRAPPRGHGRQGLHVDWPGAVLPERQRLANVFLVLDPIGHDNGATRLVPGSHRWNRVPRGAVAQPHGAHRAEIAAQAGAGDVLIFSAHLWHGGALNASGRRRRVAIAQFARPSGGARAPDSVTP